MARPGYHLTVTGKLTAGPGWGAEPAQRAKLALLFRAAASGRSPTSWKRTSARTTWPLLTPPDENRPVYTSHKGDQPEQHLRAVRPAHARRARATVAPGATVGASRCSIRVKKLLPTSTAT